MSQAKVLIADDNPGVRKVLTQCLGTGDRVLLTAEDGDAALEMARAHHPDLIILDVRMPGRDGYQVCAELRQGESTRSIPILILAGRGEAEREFDGIGCGADAYLAKPFNVNELEACVRALLRRTNPCPGVLKPA